MIAQEHYQRCLSWHGGDCNCGGWSYQIPESVAAYAAGIFHASRALPPFRLASWRAIAALLTSIGLGSHPRGELEAAALAWLAATVDPVGFAWLHTPRRASRRTAKKGPPAGAS